jgi:hypothetical protein
MGVRADFEDFSFYRMDVVDVYYVGGFGVMGWVSDSDYEHAQPDPLADATGEIIQHMNADHKDALILLARVLLDRMWQEWKQLETDIAHLLGGAKRHKHSPATARCRM